MNPQPSVALRLCKVLEKSGSPESQFGPFFPQDDETNEHIFYLKGADVVMASKVVHNDWLEEEAGELARDGFRTLVVAKKILTPEEYSEFEVSSTSPQFRSKAPKKLTISIFQ